MKLKSTLAALALSASSLAAFGADNTIAWNEDYSIGTFFGNYATQGDTSDQFGFTLFQPSYVTASLTSISLDDKSNFDFSSATLGSNNFTDLGTETVDGAEVESWALGNTLLNPGVYYVTVGGTVDGSSGGAFAGTINVSPIPEPETYALMLAGLGLVGYLGHRRRRT